ncbi:PfkB family carbohydrate kinase [Paenibacillus sp. TRM 82003]|uniref:PfkB family carbohydrate kinase n=1 Tax=Kineococcus sp. TRM81007 TaxID=2925831 RepID=UPI001F59B182|nr:PfkB family carbohydrate kinase [Kineococcus sp. TRM81007]MCI2240677.1 PfkB family carbohydrate kinase [Kineococcus sp. TRM81007]MCI3925401.1 PfkB family carbohydrate kinase [Paenibacillus sp. TRM 82003]
MSAHGGARVARRVVVVGDVLLDREVLGGVHRIAPDAPAPVVDVTEVRESPGGAGLTALLAALDPSVEVVLVAPLAADEAGARLRGLLRGVDVVALPHAGGTRRKSRVRADGQVLVRLDDGGPGTPELDGDAVEEARAALAAADVVLVSDYGAGTTRDPRLRALLGEAAQRVPVVWDPHPRGGAPVPRCAVVTPNLAEARGALAAHHLDSASLGPDEVAAELRTLWDAAAVCVTAGSSGAYCAVAGSEALHLPASPATGDPCGAGDRFAASTAVEVARTGALSPALARAVRDASAWVAAGGTNGFFAPAPAPVHRRPAGSSPAEVAARVRAAGGTLVATGGCFDVLHAGHVGCLEAARGLGDALVVLINSDDSVRRLKGPGRPVVGQADRERVLRALASVDAVGVFTEDDPRAALAELRPDVWAKGGDYGGAELPEAELVRSWGGRVVLLPYLDGRSTTSILAAGAGHP